jgi:hypothetical protein
LEATEIEQEPAFTERMLGRISVVLDGYKRHGIIWHAKTLTDRGPGAQENRLGADFLGALAIDLPQERIRKGFLAQAKLANPWWPLNSTEFVRLQNQAREMLEHSPVSYVFGYSSTTIIVVPASDVVQSDERDLHKYHHRSVASFFEEHLACLIGDFHLTAATRGQLEELLREQRLRRGLLITAVSEQPR